MGHVNETQDFSTKLRQYLNNLIIVAKRAILRATYFVTFSKLRTSCRKHKFHQVRKLHKPYKQSKLAARQLAKTVRPPKQLVLQGVLFTDFHTVNIQLFQHCIFSRHLRDVSRQRMHLFSSFTRRFETKDMKD